MQIPHENFNVLIADNALQTTILNIVLMGMVRRMPKKLCDEVLHDSLELLARDPSSACAVFVGSNDNISSPATEEFRRQIAEKVKNFFVVCGA